MQSKYRSDIDGLRGIAVLAVVLFHFGAGCPGGFVGVDVFFVLSGFLITGILDRELQTGRFSPGGFFERRVRRILPASLAVTAVTLAAVTLANAGGWLLAVDAQKAASASFWHLGMAANIFLFRDVGYFSESAETNLMLHLWSLAVEEQFYLVFPFVLWGLMRAARSWTRAALVAAAILSLAASAYGVSHATVTLAEAAFYLTPFRAWELLLGSLVALGVWRGPAHAAWRGALGWLGLAMVLVPIFFYHRGLVFPGLAALPPCLGTALLLAANDPADTPTFRLLSRAPLVMAGLVSYSLYLWHWPILAAARIVYGIQLPLEVAGCCAVAIAAASWLSWRWIERPVRERRLLASRRAVFLGAAFSAGLLAVWAYLGQRGAIFSDPRSPAVVQAASALEVGGYTLPPVQRDGALFFQLGEAPKDAPPAAPDFLVYGDSHALSLGTAFDQLARQHDLQGLLAGRLGVAPALDCWRPAHASAARRAEMMAYNEAIVRFAEKHRVKTVFLVARWAYYVEGLHPAEIQARPNLRPEYGLLVDAHAADNSPEAAREALRRGLSATIARLLGAGAEVYVLRQIPEQPNSRLAREVLRLEMYPFARRIAPIQVAPLFRPQYDARQTHANAILDGMSGVQFVDLSPVCFRDEELRILEEGHALYRDVDHVTVLGARTFASESLRPLLERVRARREAP